MREGMHRCPLILSIVAIITATLTPAAEWGGEKGNVLCVLCRSDMLFDALGNIIVFVPLGTALGLRGSTMMWTLLAGGGLSLSIEMTQFLIPGRDSNLGDLLFNTCGAALGLLLSRTALGRKPTSILTHVCDRLQRPEPRLADRLALVASLVGGGIIWLTGFLLAPAFPPVTYFVGTNVLQATSAPLRLGGNTYPGDYFRGLIDDVRLYARALTAGEIRSDMRLPVPGNATSPSPVPDLVAAYNFNEGAGTVLADASGRGNIGIVSGPVWSRHGRFDGALAFDGIKDIVVVPPIPALNLTTGMTLEAWVYPSGPQRGWSAIVQKEVDAYFLSASSDLGSLRPAGGGTFGEVIDEVKAPRPIPVRVWTHLGLTYDGTTLRLYVNGEEAARRTRWISGRVLDASVGGIQLRAGHIANSDELRRLLLNGAPIRVRVLTGPPLPVLAPFLSLQDQHRAAIALVGPERDDLVFRYRSRAVTVGLSAPDLRASKVLRRVTPGDELAVTIRRDGGDYCVDVNETASCGHGFTIGNGWALLLSSQALPVWFGSILNVTWVALICLPVGFWARPRRASCAAGLVLTASLLVLPRLVGLLATPVLQMAAAVVGLFAGWCLGLPGVPERNHCSCSSERDPV